jgi:phosphoesterase RecJ-like protein
MPSTSRETIDAAALQLLREAHSFVLVGHVRPDGDVIGAQGALSRGLMSLGKEVRILNPDQPGPEFAYLYEDCPFAVFEGGELPAHDVVVLLDFNEPSRCGAMQAAIERAPSRKLVIDHHPPTGEEWWDAAYLDFTASATGVLVHRVLVELGAEIDSVVAAGVFTSIVTDTGWFRYSNTDGETLSVAADLLETGIDPSAIYRSIYQRKPRTEPHAIAAVLARTELLGDGRLAVADQPLDCGDANALVDSDAVLDILRSVGDVEVVLYLREIEPGACKLSARSKSHYDVNRLARRFGGGGHAKAAGATIPGELSDVRARLIEAALEGLDGA